MITISEHRSFVQATLPGVRATRIWRDVTPVTTPWGPIERSAALYLRDSNEWRMVVDEFGAPTNYGRDVYREFAKVKTPEKLVRIANKNQLLVEENQVTQLSPLSWTTQFVELSALYEFLRQRPLTVPGLSGHQDNIGSVVLSRLVCLIGGETERHELNVKLQNLARRIEGLSQELQALLLVFDSDMGKPNDPFIRINERDPSELNKVSLWRCWTSGSQTEDALELMVPPVAFTGWDVYKRPVWAPSPAARIRQLCVLEVDWPVVSQPVFQVDCEQLWAILRDLIERCRKDRDVNFRFVDGITQDDRLENFMQRAEFWLKFWSHHFQELLIYGDMVPDRIYDIETEGPASSPFLQFRHGSSPFWEKGSSLSARQLLTHWCLPFCQAGGAGGWHNSLESTIQSDMTGEQPS